MTLFKSLNYYSPRIDNTGQLQLIAITDKAEHQIHIIKAGANASLGILGGLVYYGPSLEAFTVPVYMLFQESMEFMGSKVSTYAPSMKAFKHIGRIVIPPLVAGVMAAACNRFGDGEANPINVSVNVFFKGLFIPFAAKTGAAGIRFLEQVANAKIKSDKLTENNSETQEEDDDNKTKKKEKNLKDKSGTENVKSTSKALCCRKILCCIPTVLTKVICCCFSRIKKAKAAETTPQPIKQSFSCCRRKKPQAPGTNEASSKASSIPAKKPTEDAKESKYNGKQEPLSSLPTQAKSDKADSKWS